MKVGQKILCRFLDLRKSFAFGAVFLDQYRKGRLHKMHVIIYHYSNWVALREFKQFIGGVVDFFLAASSRNRHSTIGCKSDSSLVQNCDFSGHYSSPKIK